MPYKGKKPQTPTEEPARRLDMCPSGHVLEYMIAGYKNLGASKPLATFGWCTVCKELFEVKRDGV